MRLLFYRKSYRWFSANVLYKVGRRSKETKTAILYMIGISYMLKERANMRTYMDSFGLLLN